MSRFKEFLKIGAVDTASIMSESTFFKERTLTKTSLPILNVAFSGDLEDGFGCGLTVFAGDSATFKTNLSLLCLKSYLDAYDDACAFIYDSEFSIDEAYLASFGIDMDRIMHIPVQHVEELKHDIHLKLNAIKRGEHFFFLVDSLGNLVSKKTVDDVEAGKDTTDMTRAKSIKPLMGLITNGTNIKNVPCIVINHTYETQEMFSKTVISGGKAVTFNANNVFVMSRKKDVSADKSLTGFSFTITAHKSRSIKTFSKLSFDVSFDTGINPYSGILDLAVECGMIKSSGGWYTVLDENQQPVGSKLRESQCNTEEVLGAVMKNPEFKKFVNKKYKLNSDV